MQHPVNYHQNCPICGRNLLIGVTLMGRRVYCQHCGGGFIATGASGGESTAIQGPQSGPHLDAVDALIEKADMVLSRGSCGDCDAAD